MGMRSNTSLSTVQADIDRLRSDAETQLRMGDVEKALEIIGVACQTVLRSPFMKGQATDFSKVLPRAREDTTEAQRDETSSSSKGRDIFKEINREPKKIENESPIEAAPLFLLACVVHARKGNQVEIYRCSNFMLDPEAPFSAHLSEQEELDFLIRRGVALTHLAGPTLDGKTSHLTPAPGKPYVRPCFELIEFAEADLLEVHKRRPKDPTVKRGLECVDFLKTQAEDFGDRRRERPLKTSVGYRRSASRRLHNPLRHREGDHEARQTEVLMGLA
mmetsp:Transcript_11814/g.31888  ORF Transcript_11814/g.31888 Transcript_11814/m.31888 type:complete len:275 (-) Transcript_11814:211-1035(-)